MRLTSGIKSIYMLPALLCVWLLCLMLSGCTDELLGSLEEGNAEGGMTEMDLEIETAVPFGDFRATRAEDGMGNTDVISLWVGVYDIQTGNRVGARHFSYPGARVKVPVIYYDQHPNVVIVGAANYGDLTDWNGTPLRDCLDAADTWDAFVDLNIKAPLNNGIPDINPSAPQPMTGLLTGSDSPRPFFTTSDSHGVTIQNATGYEVKLTGDNIYGPMTKTIEGRKLYLTRVHTQVNVYIIAGSDAEVTDVSYRRCNMPLGVYLAEHPTYTGSAAHWNDYSIETPNFVDLQMRVSNGNAYPEGCYIDDAEWTAAGTNNAFTFTHLDNKHWGQANYLSPEHSYREKLNNNSNVVSNLQYSYNNQASYFIVRMKILDKKENKSAYVEYTIHEGNINTANGEYNGYDTRANDYCAFRNMIYNYNITVNGIDYVDYNVTANSSNHHDGASGEIWGAEFHEMTAYTSWGQFQYYYTNITISTENPEPLFRFYVGRGENQAPLDYIYGTIPNDIDAIYWPAIDANTRRDNIPAGMGDRIKIYKNNSVYSLDAFANDARNNGGTYQIRFYPITRDSQWYPEVYRMGFYYYSNGLKSGLSGSDKEIDDCTSRSSKAMHVAEWKPAQKTAQKLNTLSNLPSPSGMNILDSGVTLDFNQAHNNSGNNSYGTLNQDYVYVVTFNGTDYTLGDDLRLFLPMKNLKTSNSYTIRAEAVNTKLVSTSNNANGSFSLNSPSQLNFGSDDFADFFDDHFYTQTGRYTAPQDLRKLYKSYYWICVKASKEIGMINEDPRYLYFNNTGNGNGIQFTVYKNCKITLSTYLKKGGRTVYIVGADPQTITPQKTDQVETLQTVSVTLGDNETSKDISIYYSGDGGGYFVNLLVSE